MIPDSAERVNKGFGLTGKTEQLNTRGVNLWRSDSTVIVSGTKYLMFDNPIQTGTYTLSAIFANDKSASESLFTFYNEQNQSMGGGTIKQGGRQSKTFTLTGKAVKVLFYASSGYDSSQGVTTTIKEIQLETGTTATPYEPYTGGKPSPSQEYQQEIKNVGKWNEETQKYEVDVKVCNSGYLQKGSYADKIRAFPLEKGKTYRIYVNVNSAVVNTGILDEETTFNHASTLYAYCNKPEYPINNTGIISGKCKIPNNLSRGYTFTVTVDGLFLYQGVNAVSLNTDDAYIAYDFIKTVDMTSPYTEKDPLTITSDRPITKWDRLVEQGGQIGWLYGTKKYTITGNELFQYGAESYHTGSSTDMFYVIPDATDSAGIMNDLSFVKGIWNYTDKEAFCVNVNQLHVRLYNTRIGVSDDAAKEEKFKMYKAFMAKRYADGTPFEVYYKTTKSEFVTLPQSEQNAIRALKTYYPTTVITADGGELDPDIKVTYTADTKLYIDNKFAQLQKSLVNTNTQLL